MPSHTPPQPQHHPSPLSILTPRLYHPLSRCPSMPWVRTPRRSQWMEIPSQLQPQLNGTSGFHVFSVFLPSSLNASLHNHKAIGQRCTGSRVCRDRCNPRGEHSPHHRAGGGEEAKMLCANRLSRSAYNMALEGWVSVQICPARAVCQNPIEKTLGNPYFFRVSRFPEHSCDSHGVSPALSGAWSRWCRPRV